jgi:diaminopimelate decarboxylase
MTAEQIDAFRRLHETKVRLLKAGWRFEERDLGGGFEVRATNDHQTPGYTAWRDFYSDALDDALRFASHAQARLDARAP